MTVYLRDVCLDKRTAADLLRVRVEQLNVVHFAPELLRHVARRLLRADLLVGDLTVLSNHLTHTSCSLAESQ